MKQLFIFSNDSYQPFKFSEPIYVLYKLLRFVISMTTCVYGISAGVSENEAEVIAWQSDIVIVYRRYRGKS